LNGKVTGNVGARDYYSEQYSGRLRDAAHAAYDRLRRRFEYIVIEGAGSIAEVNLMSRDFVNLSMAEYANARGLLVADIDRGGVFAAISGTLDLLSPHQRALIRSVAVNRFRGDVALFQDGVTFLEQRTGIPCLGVFPMARDIHLDAEDSVSLDDVRAGNDERIMVVRLPRISNFTDFRLLPARWIDRPVNGPIDWIIIPGTKNTIADLDWMRAQGLDEWIIGQHRNGANILGICGGFQMLGETITDPNRVETEKVQASGLGLLPVQTVLKPEKITKTVTAITPNGHRFGAYEIHMGRTTATRDVPPFALVEGQPEGARCGRVLGTYLHGALESPAVIEELFGIAVDALPATEHYDRLATWFESAADMRRFEEIYL
jgi:adenosylcobyric acid synthase